MIDVKERYSASRPLSRSAAIELKAAFLDRCVAMFGAPNFLLMDCATTALSPEFAEYIQDLGTAGLRKPTAPRESSRKTPPVGQTPVAKLDDEVKSRRKDG